MTETVVQEESITALKLARDARWTVSTGAASHYRAGFVCRLALR